MAQLRPSDIVENMEAAVQEFRSIQDELQEGC
jgi:hypothetical protein